jgi:hypothetical protein
MGGGCMQKVALWHAVEYVSVSPYHSSMHAYWKYESSLWLPLHACVGYASVTSSSDFLPPSPRTTRCRLQRPSCDGGPGAAVQSPL